MKERTDITRTINCNKLNKTDWQIPAIYEWDKHTKYGTKIKKKYATKTNGQRQNATNNTNTNRDKQTNIPFSINFLTFGIAQKLLLAEVMQI